MERSGDRVFTVAVLPTAGWWGCGRAPCKGTLRLFQRLIWRKIDHATEVWKLRVRCGPLQPRAVSKTRSSKTETRREPASVSDAMGWSEASRKGFLSILKE